MQRIGRRTARRWADAPLLVKGLVVLGLPTLALILTAVTGFTLLDASKSYRDTGRASEAAMTQASQTLQLLTDAETAVRGYAATGDPSFLAPYDQAVRELPGQLQTLRRVVPGQGRAGAAVGRVETLAGQEMTILGDLKQGVAANQLHGPALSQAMLAGKGAMDRIRGATATIQQSETAALARARHASERLQGWVLTVDIAGLVVGILGGVCAMLLFVTGIVRRARTVSRNADRFVEGLPMEHLAPSRDEIGKLAMDIEDAAVILADRNEELRITRDLAVSASKAKDEFLSRVSHELRTPLTAILGFGQLLQMDELGEEQASSVDQIVGAGQHLLNLINEILDIARIESGHLSLSMEAVAVREVIDEAVALIAPLAEGRDLTLRVHGGNLGVNADRQRLKQVLLNLLSNAVKYNREGGSIAVSYELQAAAGVEDKVGIAVTDTGEGIDEADLPRLFVPFDRLEAGHSDVEGTGVGLALSKSLVEAMGGELLVSSRPGLGSTFAVVLRAADMPMTPAATPAPAGEGTGSGPTVLYVEDNLTNLRVMEHLLKHRPESLETAVQGSMCLTLAQRLHPELIVLDLHLPDMDGEVVLCQLKADPRTASIPVVILSAEAGERRHRRLMEAGAAECLTKPLDVHRFMEILDGLQPRPSLSAR